MKKQRNIYHPPIHDLQYTCLSCAGSEAGACPSSNWAKARAKQPTGGLTFKASLPRVIYSKPINFELGGNWKAYKLTI